MMHAASLSTQQVAAIFFNSQLVWPKPLVQFCKRDSTSEFGLGAAIEFGVAKWMLQFLSRIFVFARHCFSFTSNWRLPVGPCADQKMKDSNYFTSSDPTDSIIFGHFISHVLGYVIYLTHSDILSDILSHTCSDIGILSGILSDIMKTHNFRVK